MSPWPTALSTALESLSNYTPARPGDRTVIDSLSPFCNALASGSTFEESVLAARRGAESTRGMKAKLGRATYVGDGGEAGNGDVIPPDPGAVGVAAIVEGVYEGFSGIKMSD